MMNETMILSIRNLSKRFGGLVAIKDLDMNIYQGEIVGLIGPNGAGKSTIFNVISGFLSPTKGNCVFKETDITRLSPHARAKKGMARVFQGNVLFKDLTVLTNVLIGMRMRTNTGFLGSIVGSEYSHQLDGKMHDKAIEILEIMDLTDKTNAIARSLSHGNQRLLCLAIALASDPELLLLDEPVTGMNALEVSKMMSIIKMLRDKKGITSVLVEHNMKAVMNLCDRIYVISYGSKIAEGVPSVITSNPLVIEAYLGAEENATDN